VLGTIKRLGLDVMISPKRSRERDLVVAMIAERLIHPCSKLATTRLWHTTTLAEELCVGDADVDELYDAMDWLLSRQEKIEKRLAEAHLSEGSMVLMLPGNRQMELSNRARLIAAPRPAQPETATSL
jgi:hypothetical protein